MYQQMIAQHLLSLNDKYIKNTPQPVMMGGTRNRKYVLSGYTNYNSGPSTLSVGELDYKKHPNRNLDDEDKEDEDDEMEYGIFKDEEAEERMGEKGGRIRKFKDERGGKHNVKTFVNNVNDLGKLIPKSTREALVNKTNQKISGMGRGRKRKMSPNEYLDGGNSELLYPEELLKSQPYPKVRMMNQKKGGAVKRSSIRGELIKKIMNETGLNLGQASKYIKEQGL